MQHTGVYTQSVFSVTVIFMHLVQNPIIPLEEDKFCWVYNMVSCLYFNVWHTVVQVFYFLSGILLFCCHASVNFSILQVGRIIKLLYKYIFCWHAMFQSAFLHSAFLCLSSSISLIHYKMTEKNLACTRVYRYFQCWFWINCILLFILLFIWTNEAKGIKTLGFCLCLV